MDTNEAEGSMEAGPGESLCPDQRGAKPSVASTWSGQAFCPENPLTLLVALLALGAALLVGWGPGNHLEFAHRVWRKRRALPARARALIEEERPSYQYGNIAADIINFKAIGGPYNHCHRWSIIAAMNKLASSPEEEAFVLGYLSHLAADTIAHNHFVPYHLARYARTKGLGHLYWEMNADRFVPEARWDVVTRLKADADLERLDDLVNRTVPKKALPMGTNKLLFNHVLLVSERESWRRGIARLHPATNLRLRKGFLRIFQDAAVDRILLALRPKGFAKLDHIDTNGKAAQALALKKRTRILHRLRPGRMRAEESEEIAAPFLEGMESPPPRASRQ
jgi:hypothetical protein